MALPLDPRGRELAELLARAAYERWLAREAVALLRAGFREVAGVLTTEYATLNPHERSRLAALGSRIRTLLTETYGQVDDLTRRELGGLAIVESDRAKAVVAHLGIPPGRISAGFGVLSTEQVRAIADLPIQGLTLGEWWKAQASTMTDATRRQIQTGLLLGEPTREIVKRILPPREAGTLPSVYRRARRDATVIVRTATTAVAANASLETFRNIGVRRVRFRATLDGRTTPVCRARDGEVYAIDDKRLPVPPLHISCRSVLQPEIDWAALGMAPPPATGVLGFKDYATWLRSLPEAEQDRILGRERAALFRAGKVTLKDLVDDDGRTITLRELRKRYGLSPIPGSGGGSGAPPPQPPIPPTPPPGPPDAPQIRQRLEAVDARFATAMAKAEAAVWSADQRYEVAKKSLQFAVQTKGPGNAGAELAEVLTRRERLRRRGERFKQLTASRLEALRTAVAAAKPSDTTVTFSAKLSKSRKEVAQDGVGQFNRFVSFDVFSGQSVAVLSSQKARSSYSLAQKAVLLGTEHDIAAMVHELGHALEHRIPSVLARALAYRATRTAGNPLEKLSKLTGKKYGAHEVAKLGGFINPYIGKEYAVGGTHYATELISMGIEYFYQDPLKFARQDPGMFDFIYRLLNAIVTP